MLPHTKCQTEQTAPILLPAATGYTKPHVSLSFHFAFSALTLLVEQQERHLACKKMEGMVEVGTV